MNEKPYMVHIVTPYLFHTGSWIYTQIKGIKSFNKIVFTYKKENLNQFPLDQIYSYQDFNILKKILYRFLSIFNNNYLGLFFSVYIKKFKPKFFHAHMGYEAVRWLYFIKSMNLPLVTTFYGQDVSKLGRNPYWQNQYKKLFKYGKIFLAEGSYLKKQLMDLGCEENKIIIQHLGVNLENYKAKEYIENVKGEKIIILQISTFREKKGIEYSLEAISILIRRHKNIEYQLLGGGDDLEAEKKVYDLVKLLKIENYVKFLGIKTHKESIEILQNCDIFLHPSVTAEDGDNEGGAPVSIIEASACAIPVVSSIHADIPEVIINNKTGFLVKERDSNSLADKLELLIDNQQQRKNFGIMGRIHISQNYNISIQLEKLKSIYNDLIDED